MRGRGRIEFISCKDEIISLLNKGYSIQKIYNKLYSEGKISIKYAFFHRILTKNNMQTIKMKPLITKANNEGFVEKRNQVGTNSTDTSSQEGKPLFEIKRLGDDAFE